MKDVEIIKLQRRVSHLERKLVVWASRMKKEVIWRKYMEDWVMQKFNFDLRLQVELKTLEEDGVDEFEKEEFGRPPGRSNLVNVGTRQPQPQWTVANRASAVNNINQQQSFSTPTNNEASRNSRTNPLLQQQQQQQQATSRGTQPTITMQALNPGRPMESFDRPNTNTVPGFDRNRMVATTLQNQIKRRKMLTMTAGSGSGPRPSIRQSNPVIISTTSIPKNNNNANPPRSPEVIVLDQEDVRQASSSTTVSRIINNTNPINPSRESSVQQIDNLVRNLITGNSGPNNNESGVRTENADSSCSNDIFSPIDYAELESFYISNGYIARTPTSIEYNIRKILIEYDPESTEQSIDHFLQAQVMSLTTKKNITCAVSEFLMQVYAENPPRFAKESMAMSLFNCFPFVAKETWYCKVPLKNPTGHLEHRINNRRRQIVEERKKQLNSDDGKCDAILGLAQQ